MDPVTAAVVGILLMIVIGGVWGYAIISGLMKRRLMQSEGEVSATLLEDLRADYAQLEGRLQHVEEELDFLRALREPAPPGELPPPEKPGE